jgi:hypothetical protein
MNNINEIPTYLDLKYAQTSRVFESKEIYSLSPDQLYESEQAYDKIVEKLEQGQDLDEGILTGLLGAGVGALAGPAIGRAICKVLGIDQEGTLGKLLTSRLVTTAMGYALGK